MSRWRSKVVLPAPRKPLRMVTGMGEDKTILLFNEITEGTQNKCGSWLACDADNSVFQSDRGDAIAGKPAPT
ncbi:hypothetical protein C7U57_22010 [Pseudomonas sp. R9.37]|nr:hypothetical protein C7U57_22010 [Pseudomonas sp. R9.37]